MVPPVSYKDCNSALNKVFFDGRFAGQPVYLTLDNDMREEVGKHLRVEPDLVEAAICQRVGQWLDRRGNPYETTVDAVELWRRVGMKSQPLFTAILFCLSHAASIMAAEEDFAANNYYLRLAQVTGIERQRLSQHGKSTDMLWSALRDWLVLNNYGFGKPTAVAATTWKYVGKAMSQAAVRAGDRELFHDLFGRYGFSGSEIISLKEMEFYLSYWIIGGRANSRLKNVWSKPELRERVAEAALAELSKWSSSGPGTMGSRPSTGSSRLSMLANFVQRFPRQLLELHLGRIASEEASGPFKTEGGSQEFSLSSDRFGGYSTLAPSPLVASIGHRCHLVPASPGLRPLDWQPRLVIPLAKSAQDNLWVEVAKVSFGIPHVLLVRDAHGLPGKVESYLAIAAMKMPEKASPSDLPGLPLGWILYKDVQVRQPGMVPSDDLECLVPWSNDGVLSIGEGLQLLPGFYHASRPVMAEFLATEGPTRVEAWTQDESPKLIAWADGGGNTCSLRLDAARLRFPRGIKVKAYQDGSEQASAELYFRDSNSPHPLNRDNKGRLAYRSVVSATAIRDDASGIAVSGMEPSEAVPSRTGFPMETAGPLPDGVVEEMQVPVVAAALQRQASAETCIERGYHYWICETLPPGRPRNTPLEQRCNGCGAMVIILHRGTHQAGVLPPLPIPISRLSQPASPHANAIDANELLDALCFLGCGNWGKFQALAGLGNDPTSTSARQVAQDFFLLGFLDTELSPGSSAIKSWCVPRATINFIDDRRAFLSGFRSPNLLDAIKRATKQHAGRVFEEDLPGRPRMILLDGLDATSAKSAFSGLKDPLEREIAINDRPGDKLAGACQKLESIASSLRQVSIGRPKSLQKFDVPKARWIDAGLASRAGAYRWNEGYQVYAYVAPNGTAWAGSYQVVKLLAARAEGVSLWQYSEAQASFRATLGCDPPGLLGRVLVACSGLLPTLGRGIISYSNIGPTVASSVMSALSMENFDEGDHRRSQSG
ncbi:hypothetical protein [Sinorhizobium meliloti]|uniref:Hypothetical transmembrane protein n=1 Tax=Rhizobium meliloti (strain 1021) TaxID=266834 RepID=Q92LC4_RHIME|nr:hypothetical protein [Sinorhizobium meliloti]AGG75745.1 putative transmembrane protein [Sinorhizobium meliloti 2011]ASP58459.1 hypothetical protein CDO30_09150 [Sinorhizobium meliloti]MCK3802133.1 hypothetical protein [Sinorhizobium meliloti]MCK3806034.1 hypothetical protein [Sinorhizobium meliloti]MCK3814117.1 hypothetical protein [Sinorhizobium meliloti]